jgi:mannitol-1-phosphate 5-dehydrogenase
MTPTGDQSPGSTYVGFGLGAIQAGLFLYEAMASKAFQRLVVAEVVPEIVAQVRANQGFIDLNIAHSSGIERARLGPLDVYNPAVAADRQPLIDALAEAYEIGTAVPGLMYYSSSGAVSLSSILARGLQAKLDQDRPRAVIYTAENHNQAAEILREEVLIHLDSSVHSVINKKVCFLNTVIGKMSGVITGKDEIDSLGLIPMFPGSQRAILVEDFNRILISKIAFPDGNDAPCFRRGITSFIEKDNLLPFEEAKLYGHNAAHAAGAYLGALLGLQRMAEIPAIPGLLEFLCRAFIEESGAALIHRYAGLDALFTPEGYACYASDLLDRMTNPWLSDKVERVGRDVQRKLGWDDRLVGVLRLCLAEGVIPRRFALGAAAALAVHNPAVLINLTENAETSLRMLWGPTPRDAAEEEQVFGLINDAVAQLRKWQFSDRRNISALFV